ncbi:hypothetical protein MMC28_010046 [Mycoblastus sanguinarius]|nr:hypothetical protein [Mycoblastus sanguinarius]
MASNPILANSAMYIYLWAQDNHVRIRRAFAMKGGWEHWLQVELGIKLANEPFIKNIEREKHVYNTSGQAADLFITTTLNEGLHQTMIELKSKTGTNNIPTFANRLRKELDGIEDIADGHKPCQVACIGFSNTPEARAYASAQQTHGQNAGSKDHFQVLSLFPADQNDDLTMWYWTA